MTGVETTFRTSIDNSCSVNVEEGSKNKVTEGYFNALYLYGKTISEMENPKNQTQLLQNMKSTTLNYTTDTYSKSIIMNQERVKSQEKLFIYRKNCCIFIVNCCNFRAENMCVNDIDIEKSVRRNSYMVKNRSKPPLDTLSQTRVFGVTSICN